MWIFPKPQNSLGIDGHPMDQCFDELLKFCLQGNVVVILFL